MKEKRRKQDRITKKANRIRHRAILWATSIFLVLTFSILTGGFIARAQRAEENGRYKYFTSIQIMPGDTLWTLADQYCDENFRSRDSFIREVLRTNHLLDHELREGYYLIVPYYSTERKP